MYNPVEYYYSNDYYLSQITNSNFNRVNTSYSPKKVMMSIFRNDCKPFIKQKTLNLESKEIHPHIVRHKCIKQSFTKLAESILSVSNCFDNIPNTYTKTEKFVQKLKPKITTPSPTPPKPHNHEIYRIPGRLHKGALLRNFDNSINQIDKSYILDSKQELGTLSMSPKPRAIDCFQEQVRQKNQQISNTVNMVSHFKELQQQLTIRKSILNNEITTNTPKQPSSNIIDQTIQAMKVDCFYTKLSLNNINHLVMIQFENVLGFDESSYFGLQTDFLTSKQYDEYVVLRDHYFQKVSSSQSFYILKNFKELFNSISRVYQVCLYTIHYPQLLKEFLQERKLRVNCGFQILNYKIDTFVVDISQVFIDLQIVTPELLILIQPCQILGQQEQQISSNSKIPYYEFHGQRFFLPYSGEIHPNNCRLLALPLLSMESLLKQDEQSKGFVQISYFIEQFTLALQSESYFVKFLNKSQNRIKTIDLSRYFRQQNQKILQQLFFIDTLKIQEQKQDEFQMKKKEMIQRIIQKFDHSKQIEQYTNDLMFRNKDIFKKMRNYKQENVNKLHKLQQDLSQQVIRYNYCEMFVDTTYYLAY
ncbi:unnamed protein product (macronuclear) [Paramecium tetraurelia]|uniref:Uncharacterized protein n=1 Tax=Paramecium tetraurelia TaxID=5888 RepID=A0ECN2_PARTE|nr:uncharacterized protein GSPATT00003918001 [Paramecium tetraurelia]CAK93049.1 unnamed protein product [Paramecium tetraurelia]|eukprot:XP_001460446.1 hypothetical protein (macronuclear) [Paramecium tetraurelia strain d4-2]